MQLKPQNEILLGNVCYTEYYTDILKTDASSNILAPSREKTFNEIKEELLKNNPNFDIIPDEILKSFPIFYNKHGQDYVDKPLRVIHTSAEGLSSYKALLFIPSHAPYDYYYKEYKRGLELYTNGVLIMDKCEELVPEYYSFVKGVVDTDDLSLNISRETLQSDKHVLAIAKGLETKIHNELKDMLTNDFDSYKKFFEAFGSQIKYGIYNMYGMNKDKLKDLLVFYSKDKGDLITLDEYVKNMKDGQENIYYASGESVSKIDSLPQVEQIKKKGFDILYLTNYLDEFVISVLREEDGKTFKSVSDSSLDLDTEEEKEANKKLNEDNKDMLAEIKDALGDEVTSVRFTNKLDSHPVCLTSEGEISVEMQKVINSMPTDENVKAKLVLEINEKHDIVKKLEKLYKEDKNELKKYAKVLYSEARLIEGLSIDNPTEISNLICELIAK